MVMIRRLARGIAVLAVALAAGHLVQTMTDEQQAAAIESARPKQVQEVSAGAETATLPEVSVADTDPVATPAAPIAPAVASVGAAPGAVPAPAATLADVAPTLPEPAPAVPETPATMLAAATPDVTPQPPAPMAPVLLPADPPAAAETAPAQPAPLPTAPNAAPTLAETCPTTLDLIPEAQAMVGLSLLAPCHADERVVLRHAGLAVTARTTATGSLFVSIPALQQDAEVSVLFADQTSVAATIQVPELATLRRFGVQWMAEDAFQLQALEQGAAYGSPGHISAVNPGTGITAAKGALSLLGDASVDRPMLAEIYTYPTDPTVGVDVVVEAAVTQATCNRDLLGETITSVGGDAFITELTVATPPCDAVGDILMLKNLVPDLKIAAN